MGSLKRRLILGTAMLVLLVLGTALVGISAIRSLDQAVTTDLDAVLRGNVLASALVGLQAEQTRAAESYLTNGDGQSQNQFRVIGDSAHTIQRALRRLSGLSAEDQARLNQIAIHQGEVEVAFARAHALRDLGRPQAARTAADQAQPPTDSITAALTALTTIQQNRVQTQASSLQRLATRRQSVVWLLFIVALLLGVATAAWIIQSIDIPLARLTAATDRMGKGDLRPVDLGSMPHELQQLGESVNRMGSSLHDVVEAVIREAREVSASASDFSAMSQQLAASGSQITEEMSHVSSRAVEQAANVKTLESVFSDIRRGVTTNAGLAAESSELSHRIRSIADYHRSSIERTTASLGELRTIVSSAGEQIKRLTGQADRLADFVERVRSLADQNGVLAVNAAVESGRIHESGEGVSAVAKEIRTLADAGGELVESAERVTATLHAQIQETVGGIATGSARILAIEGATAQTGGALQEIIQAVDAVTVSAEKVVGGVKRVHGLVGDLAEHTTAVDAIARQQAAVNDSVAASVAEQTASTEEIARGAAGLFEAAQRLQALVSDFRI